MGWRTDWLYRLVFEKVEEAWRQALKDAVLTSGIDTMPEYLLIHECANFNEANAMCVLPVLRVWKFDGSTFELIPIPAAEQRPKALAIRGIFFSSGAVYFHIMPGRKQIGYNLHMGPLYGRGVVFIVWGQGRRGRLTISDHHAGWMS